ncbi:hypothetical protein GIB67_027415 [Kingdonia uniflora]|uniref:Uncharacterized protein n=1 Tax=Kingdonia uniflora TaxID=39325 RepID=A0A7J7MFP6_9MAGN|nr:hypothetical protein GIB67_027415 [Kingdonia uniflora]
MLIVTDNLKVVPESTEPCWAVFKDIGIKEVGSLVEKIVRLALKRKSNNKILFAEAGEDFVDFLFSIFAFPFGSVIKFLERTPNLGCISTLYKSVESSEFDRFITLSCRKETLLSPIIVLRLGSKNQILGIGEIVYPTYTYKGSEAIGGFFNIKKVKPKKPKEEKL